ncbi:MAG TPA: PilZ domain-containing protein [Terriglobales bacterium]|nr:PilZ domain-containing protein [Terriglobales bacterium]
MNFQALLVSKDNQTAATLTPVLSIFGVSLVPCEDAEAVSLLREQKFDAVIVDFDHPNTAEQVLQAVEQSFSGDRAVTIALLSDRNELRNLLRKGANFVLYKPVSEQSAEGTLSAVAALMKRHRRSFRVPVQAPIQLKLQTGQEVEGILLDLSENGMHVLAAQPLNASAVMTARFTLPETDQQIEAKGEVTWTNPNGEIGVRFVEASDELRATVKSWIADRAPTGPPQTPDPMPSCKLTDLSAGGCYVETRAPFPEGSLVTLSLKAGSKEEKADTIVRVMHPEYGMGLEFIMASPDQPKARVSFIEFLSSQPGIVPEISVLPRALRAEEGGVAIPLARTEDADDPLLHLLRNHYSFNQDAFLSELQSQRRGEAVAPA